MAEGIASTDILFEPLSLGNLTVKNRIFRSNISGRFDNYNGSGNPARINWELKFAKGGVGGIISSFVPVSLQGRIVPNYAMIDSDERIPFWRELGKRVHEYDCRFLMQLSHSGRQRDIPGIEIPTDLSSTAQAEDVHGLHGSAMTIPQIKEVVGQFAQGARRAREAGLDGVELHSANGYLFTQFLSSAINDRTDEYGGSLENRARFLMEVVAAIRAEVGRDFHLQAKIRSPSTTTPSSPGPGRATPWRRASRCAGGWRRRAWMPSTAPPAARSPTRATRHRLGTVLHFGAPRGRLTVSAVEYEGELVKPGDARWEMTERIAQAALVTHTTVWRQGMEYHVGGLACVPILTHDLLAPEHPLRRLLAPHMSQSMLTNYATHLTLRRSGFDVFGFSFPIDTLMRYYNDGAASFDILRLDVAADARARGIGDRLEYPYLPQALRYWATFEAYVRAYVEHTYPSEESLAGDRQAQLWFEALDRYMVRGVRRYVAMLDKENLIRLCTLLIYGQALGHTENSLFNYACFLPTSVHRDGTQQTVGEVQCAVNFQYLITARTTLMMDDFSHLALDDGARRVMRDFRQSLLDLQADMAAEEPRYWQLFPAELEAAVSA